MFLTRRGVLQLITFSGMNTLAVCQSSAEATTKQNIVTITDTAFRPSHIDIQVGETVTWTNEGDFKHSAWDLNDAFDTGILQPGQTATLRFNRSGTYTYRCRRHAQLRATITVNR